MSDTLERRLSAFASGGFGDGLRGCIGIEKEGLRVDPDGYIAATAHPAALGSALTNRFITTDYSEALLEFVTPPVGAPWEAIQFLCDVHAFTYEHLGDEMIWALSMPCLIRSERDIPLARYGSSNVGVMKTAYRRGLGYRYGRYMQAIAGIHFNFSLPDRLWSAFSELEKNSDDITTFRSAIYLAAVRNVRRLDWLLLYLFGASPAVCKSFMQGTEPCLTDLDRNTYFSAHATSLRMSDIGYQNANQAELKVSANSLHEYIEGLTVATRTPSEEFAKIGVRNDDGSYRQLSPNKLQIENEYYSTIRPKRVARSGERPTSALRRGGVEYVELRALDINPFDPVGVNQRQIRFLEVFLVYCMLADSPPIDTTEQTVNDENRREAARRGREPGLVLSRRGRTVPLRQWGLEVCEGMLAVSEALDPDQSGGFADSVRAYARSIEDPELTPSARFLAELRETRCSLFDFGMMQSRGFRDYFQGLAPELNRHGQSLADESRQSLARQADIEAADTIDFDEYLARYFA